MRARLLQFFRFATIAAAALAIFVMGAARVAAQGEVASRYLYFLRNPDAAQRPVLDAKLAADGGQLAGDLFFPDFGFIGVVGVFAQPVAIIGDANVEVVRDVPVYVQGGPLGPAWPHNQFQQPPPGIAANDTPPVVYVVDTGISPGHPDFLTLSGTPPVLTFAPGFSYARNTLTNTPLPEYPDNHDHGTRIAGCVGGRVTGLLGPLGGRATVKSIAIFDTPQQGNLLAAFASQAISGVLRAATDHKARKALPYLKSRASVLVFAHATRLVDGRFGALDNAIEKAWNAGMHVVISAGNEGINAALISPAGAAWGYTAPGPPLVIMRFWSGALPPGAALFQAAQEFTVAGACDLVGGVPQLWAQTNLNAGPVAAVDGFAPGANVPCAAAAGPPYAIGNGTSYSAGLTAALVTWSAWMRPWAGPALARRWFNNSMTVQPSGWSKIETPVLPPAGLSYAEWIEEYYPAATSAPADRDPDADPDDDAVLNFVEYFAGRDPRFKDDGMDPQLFAQPGENKDTVTLRMPVASYYPPDPKVKWTLQESADLAMWDDVSAADVTPVSPQVITGDGVVSETTVGMPPATRRFFRLKFTFTP